MDDLIQNLTKPFYSSLTEESILNGFNQVRSETPYEAPETAEEPGWWQRNREIIIAQLVGALLGTLLGGLITFFVARHYYVMASQDLVKQFVVLTTPKMKWEFKNGKVSPIYEGTGEAKIPELQLHGTLTVIPPGNKGEPGKPENPR